MYCGCAAPEEGIKKAALITAEILKKSGYNMNFAPNLDIYRFEENRAVVGDRSFSKDINTITKMGMNQFNIYKSNGIIPVIKHFPGHGAAKSDSHYFSPKINFKFEELLNSDLKPFDELIKNGAECVLVGHLRIKNKTRYIPCSLSREFIIKELRRRFNFKIVSSSNGSFRFSSLFRTILPSMTMTARIWFSSTLDNCRNFTFFR